MKEYMLNKSVLITGGSKGIGLGIAESLLHTGCAVTLTGRNPESLEVAKSQLKAKGFDQVLTVRADVRTASDMEIAVQKTLDHFGGLDVVIANAGVGHFGNISALSAAQWSETIDTNLTGVFHTVKASLDALKNSKGYIITIASLAGANFFEGGAAYNASKFGLVGFSQAMMLDLRPFQIKVTTILPGSVTSYFGGHEPAESDAWKIQPEDLGQIVVDLLRMNPRVLPSKIEVRPSRPPK